MAPNTAESGGRRAAKSNTAGAKIKVLYQGETSSGGLYSDNYCLHVMLFNECLYLKLI